MTKITTEVFIDKARAVHGDKYDYSKSAYINATTPVEIICKSCNESFMQQPCKHVNKRQGCPKCRYNRAKNTLQKKYGVNNPMKDQRIKDRHRRSIEDKYGVSNVMLLDEVKQKMTDTCQRRYGKPYYSQTDEYSDKVKQTSISRYGSEYYSSTDECKRKVRNTTLSRYGVTNVMQSSLFQDKLRRSIDDKYGADSYMETDEFHIKSERTMLKLYGADHYSKTDEYKEHMRNFWLQKYGSPSFFESDAFRDHIEEYKQKAKITCLNKYGSEYYQRSESYRQNVHEIQDKIIDRKRENNTFNTSGPEERLYKLLVNRFGSDDVFRQYKSDLYPFACDFYVRSIDVYIELNAFWTHGGHFFDKNNQADLDKVEEWKSNSSQHPFYNNAIETWTKYDVKKYETARKNHINYAVFWNNDLSDAMDWINKMR